MPDNDERAAEVFNTGGPLGARRRRASPSSPMRLPSVLVSPLNRLDTLLSSALLPVCSLTAV